MTYRIVRKVWFDKYGHEGDTKYQVQTLRLTLFGRRWKTLTHACAPDGERSPTDFSSEESAVNFILHISSGGAVQEWVEDVLPGDFG